MAIEHKSRYEIDPKTNGLNERSLAVIANTLARKSTQWSAAEAKLFICAVSQINNIDDEGWIHMKKSDVMNVIKTDFKTLQPKAKEEENDKKTWSLAHWVMVHSYVYFTDNEEYNSGFLINKSHITKDTISLRFDQDYLPLVQHLNKEFVKFQLRNISDMKSKYSIALYMDLKSHYDPRHTVMHWRYSLDSLKKLFNLSPTDYVRPKTGKFDTANFYRKTLAVAEKEINGESIGNKKRQGTDLRIKIETLHKNGKSNGYVLGYDIAFTVLDSNGYTIIGTDLSLEKD